MTNDPSGSGRTIIIDGSHTEEVLNVLRKDLGKSGIEAALAKASKIIELSVDPIAGKPDQPSDGLLYGLIQSGKTSILTVSAAMAIDNGFDCLLILTTDNDPLYEQTLDRVRAALGGVTVLGKKDWKDPVRFRRQVRTGQFAIVSSKNASMLKSLLEAFEKANTRGLSVFMIDDEADQASLNTFAGGGTGRVSTINKAITDFRDYFPVNTYLQVTATPQALFLQRPDHRYHPSFTVVTEPGPDYVGGDAFFGAGRDNLLRIVDLNEVTALKASNQPTPSGQLPSGLKRALCAFLVGAAAKIIERPDDPRFAFLCHVSMSTKDHEYTRLLLDDFKADTIGAFNEKSSAKYRALEKAFREAYEDLGATEPKLPPFDRITGKIEFYIKGANIKVINATTNDEIKLDSKFNIFVGGNKLGRGVTIKNLLVSYYGRNPRTPKADTVLQHARMYGYRNRDLGVTRLFLPQRLADNFTSIHEMETALRDLLKHFPEGTFEGLYISGPWDPTRTNVLDPDTVGYYVAGKNCNPRHPLRTREADGCTAWIDGQLKDIKDDAPYQVVTVSRILELIERVKVDPQYGAQLWNQDALRTALNVLKKRPEIGDRAYLIVRRKRNLEAIRTEGEGVYSSAEAGLAPMDAPTLFMFRNDATAKGEVAVWWPQLRFPAGNYVLAFSFDL